LLRTAGSRSRAACGIRHSGRGGWRHHQQRAPRQHDRIQAPIRATSPMCAACCAAGSLTECVPGRWSLQPRLQPTGRRARLTHRHQLHAPAPDAEKKSPSQCNGRVETGGQRDSDGL